MGLAREAVDAAVLATLVGVDRLEERDVGRVVPGDQATGRLGGDDGLEQRRLDVETAPAIVEGDDLVDLEPPRPVLGRPEAPRPVPGRLEPGRARRERSPSTAVTVIVTVAVLHSGVGTVVSQIS